MSQVSHFVEDGRARRPEEPGPRPLTIFGLLSELGLMRASREEQRAGVARWLAENEPLPILLDQLKRHGLVDGVTAGIARTPGMASPTAR